MNLSEQLINLSARLLLANNTEERLNLSSELSELAKQTIPLSEQNEKITATGFLKFTSKEISKMPKNFKKTFIANGAVAHVRKRPCGRHTVSYEIRYRCNGYNISVSSTDLETAKEKFIKVLSSAEQCGIKKAAQLKFEDIAEEWFSCHKNKIAANTYKGYYGYYTRYILPSLKGKRIQTIRSAELVQITNQLREHGRAYEDVRTVLNQIFEYAKLNNLIHHNPVKLVAFIRAERQSGEALSNAEIEYMRQRLHEPQFDKYRTALLLQLYFGLRPCEITDVRIDGNFLVARNAKRKRGKIEYKRIPFSNMAKEEITALPTLDIRRDTLNKIFQRIFPKKTQYDLRHTFSSKCQEFVRQEIVEVWLGDSPVKLIGQTYTHYSDEFMLSEMSKVIY